MKIIIGEPVQDVAPPLLHSMWCTYTEPQDELEQLLREVISEWGYDPYTATFHYCPEVMDEAGTTHSPVVNVLWSSQRVITEEQKAKDKWDWIEARQQFEREMEV